jgi:sigma-B regulation protein RsbU (phosphoserine phosphatase)
MLPYIFPAFPERLDFDIYAIMEPAKEVGGDFYDFFFIDENNLALVIADISDKGISAALFMVIAKILIKNQFQDGSSPAEVFEIVNNKLCENNDAGMFVTAFSGIFNIRDKKFTFANAGHNLPFMYKNSDNKFEILKSQSNFVLGATPNTKFQNQTLDFSTGDAVFMYTDGVTDATNPVKEFYSAKRLDLFLNECGIGKAPLKEVINKIYENIKTFEGKSERADDITMLMFKLLN